MAAAKIFSFLLIKKKINGKAVQARMLPKAVRRAITKTMATKRAGFFFQKRLKLSATKLQSRKKVLKVLFMTMDEFIDDYFHKVIPLHEAKNLSWEEVVELVPFLSRGWFELSRLPKEDRVEFTKEFWFSKLPFNSSNGIFLEEALQAFFAKMEDVSVFLTQETEKKPFDAHMIYSLKDNVAFFQGNLPAKLESIAIFKRQFETFTFPLDYLAFLEIHDGFSKYSDRGLIKIKDMSKIYLKFQDYLLDTVFLSEEGLPIDPANLIPFYEAEPLHTYQCFYAEWFPEEEMGNIEYDDYVKQKVSYLFDGGNNYKTFLSWFLNYLGSHVSR